MRVLHLVTAYPRSEGDPITPWLARTLEGLRAEGIEAEVLAPAYRGSGEQVVGGIRVFRFRYAIPRQLERLTHEETTPDRLQSNPAYALLLPGYLSCGCAAAARLQRRRHYDVVHVHWAVPHGLMGWAARAAGARALVTTFYGAELAWAEQRFRPARRFLKSYCRAGTLVAISTATRRALERYTTRAIHVIPYPASFHALEPSRGRDAVPDVPTVLYVGRLVERKGVANLLRAAGGSEIAYRVVIVGFGPEESRLRRLSEELGLAARVEFTGQVTENELARRYAAADVFVLPATLDARGDTEGLGVVLLEALGHGVPVVATRRGGIPDIVLHEETGLLVEDGDVSDLRLAIERLLRDRALAARLARAGREHVLRNFSVASVAARLAEVYREAAGGDVGGGARRGAGAGQASGAG